MGMSLGRGDGTLAVSPGGPFPALFADVNRDGKTDGVIPRFQVCWAGQP